MEITGNDALTAGRSPAEAPPGRRLRLCEARGKRERRGRRVLIVDDDPAIRLLCAVNLEIEGLVVLEAADGKRGLEQARSEHPDLVVTDVMMPGFSGFDLAEALRRDERTREIPSSSSAARPSPPTRTEPASSALSPT